MTATILVLEKRPRWRPGLQREFDSLPITVRACSNSQELQASVADCRTKRMRCLVLIDLSSAVSSTLQFLAKAQMTLPEVSTVLIGSNAHASLEPTLRELGASSFHQVPLRRDRLAAECLRLLKLDARGTR